MACILGKYHALSNMTTHEFQASDAVDYYYVVRCAVKLVNRFRWKRMIILDYDCQLEKHFFDKRV